MGKIAVLPDEIRNKIAAGEVVERPASVVKELMENAIDAKANRIGIEIRQAGKALIGVTDDGEGMDEEDIFLAVQSHTTSKIARLEDLYNIRTLGFRGEALSAIASISFLKIISRTPDSELAPYLELEAGKVRRKGKTSHAVGTSVEVRNLFFNTPARRKFLKSENTELGHILELVIKFALSFPEIEFRFTHNGKLLLDLKKEELFNRVEQLFPETKGKLLFFEEKTNLFELKAFLSPPDLNYPRRSRQYLFVNRRAVRSPLIYHAIDSSYQGVMKKGSYPAVFLFLKMQPALIDVNVHPSKNEIKFRNEREVHDKLVELLRRQLAGEKIIPRISLEGARVEEKSSYRKGEETLPFFRDSIEQGVKETALEEIGRGVRPWLRYLYYHKRYIIWLEEEGINILDQHAGWEKVLFQKFSQAREGKELEVERLLLPEVINLNLREAILLKENLEIFKQLGFEVKEFGETSFIVHSRPVFLKKSPQQIIKEVISELVLEEKVENKYHKLISSLACHSAVRSGDNLSQQEVERLIQEVKKLEVPYCPHARPALILIPWKEIEKEFKRR